MGDFVLDIKIGVARDYMHICTSESYKGDTMRVSSACYLSTVSQLIVSHSGIINELYIWSKGANMMANFFTKFLANIFDFAVIFRLV